MEGHIDTDGFYTLRIHSNETQIAKSFQFSASTFLCIALLEIPHVHSNTCFKLEALLVTPFSVDLPLCSHEREESIGHYTYESAFWPCGFSSDHRTHLALSFPFFPRSE